MIPKIIKILAIISLSILAGFIIWISIKQIPPVAKIFLIVINILPFVYGIEVYSIALKRTNANNK
jgi:hypothetical protein